MPSLATRTDVETAVAQRYSAGAQEVQPALCCPVDYDPRFLAVIPEEVLERDYGCGDPSRYLVEGGTVLDLGCGAGKICFIASQVVGAAGRVIGVDLNDDMLALARGAAPVVAQRIGHDNVEFRKGRIQDLALDLDALDRWLASHPVTDVATLATLEAEQRRLRAEQPLVADGSVDAVVSNCVLNLVATEHKEQLFAEAFRVLRRGGRAVISDIVSAVEVPDHLRADPELWSGCISGAYQEEAFLAAFERAGFYGVHLVKRDSTPWRVVDSIEFRSVTVIAYKGKQGECRDHGQAVIYSGPFKAVLDDDEHVFPRGAPTAVCAKSFEIYSREPYAGAFHLLEPAVAVDPATAPLFDCAPQTASQTPTEPASVVRRAVSGLTTAGGNATTGCC
ncbi:MAG TPA: methyltransferase domain-containing protein [Pseudonocardiaceae bacterium]|nr:methyltransferase domain-containing protein [Pseudonocardiaceae bacterium]